MYGDVHEYSSSHINRNNDHNNYGSYNNTPGNMNHYMYQPPNHYHNNYPNNPTPNSYHGPSWGLLGYQPANHNDYISNPGPANLYHNNYSSPNSQYQPPNPYYYNNSYYMNQPPPNYYSHRYRSPNGNDIAAKTSKYKDVESWLKTRKLLNEFSDQYVDNNSKFVEEIVIQIFGSWKKLIYHMIDEADKKNKNNDIYKILKHAKQTYYEHDEKEEKNENNGNEMDKNCYFDKLSLTSITNICGYLNKNDLKTFKCTSSSIAIQCLLEMKKYTKINVFNMNEFNHYYKYKYLSMVSSLSTFKQFKNDRYPKPVALSSTSLIDIWSNKYQISQKNIMLLRRSGTISSTNNEFLNMILDSDIITAHRFYSDHHLSRSTGYQWFISIVDKTQLLFIDYDGKLVTKKLFDDDLKLDDHVLILLYYFNIKKQNIEFCKTMIVEQRTYYHQIVKCIENNIHSFIGNIDDDDTEEFMDIFNNAQHPKITIFDDCIAQITKNDVMIFGLNDSAYFEHPKKIKNSGKTEKFYSNPSKLRYNVRQRLKIRQQNIEILEGDQNESDLGLNTMSTAILENICSFLSKKDKTKRVKLICTSIAIVCLNGMELSRNISIPLIQSVSYPSYPSYTDSNGPPPPPPPPPPRSPTPRSPSSRRKKKKHRKRRDRDRRSRKQRKPLPPVPNNNT